MTPCAICGTTLGYEQVWCDLGDQPWANELRSNPAQQRHVTPLQIAQCPTCHHLQLLQSPPPAELYVNYPYRGGLSAEFRAQCLHLAREAQSMLSRDPVGVLDIGSNDGTMLCACLQAGMDPDVVWGVDYAPNHDPAFRFNVVTGAFPEVAPPLAQYDLVFMLNTLNAVQDLHAVAEGVRSRLSPMGLWVIQVPYAVPQVLAGQFDSMYHEHRHYWLVTPLQRLLQEHGLDILSVELSPQQGGSIVVHVGHMGSYPFARGAYPWPWWEEAQGWTSGEALREFQYRAHWTVCELRAYVRQYPWVAGYGASAKAAVLASHAGLTVREVPVVYDDTPEKQHRYTCWGAPVIPLPVTFPDDPLAEGAFALNHQPEIHCKPPAVLAFAWNVGTELATRLWHAGYRGDLILPFPKPRVVRLQPTPQEGA